MKKKAVKKRSLKKLSIERIRTLGVINENMLNTWADACTVLLEFRNHKSPVKFNISGPIKQNTQLDWKTISNKTGYEDLENTAAEAGYGMALLIATELKGLIPVKRRAKGDGVDIVCSKEKRDDENFLSVTKEDYYIECKGSRSQAYVKRYLDNGVKQSENAPGNVYVISTEFETPSALTHFRK
jgi:hypothetical protein